MLKAGLSRADGIGDLVLGSPKAWLGTAYHQVIEALSGVGAAETLESLWENAVERQYARARTHPLNARFGPPMTWPGYYVMLETLRLRAKQLQQFQTERQQSVPTRPGMRTTYRETNFSALNGKLTGRPDLVLKPKIIDYKTGSVVEETGGGTSEIQAGYARQLRLYAHLVHESLGSWPTAAQLIPLHGNPVDIDIDPTICESEAQDAVARLDTYNELVRDETTIETLANPSPGSCKWCPFKLVCNAFWDAVDSSWSGQLDGEAISGHSSQPMQLIHAGLAAALSINSTAGTVTGAVTCVPLRPVDAALSQAAAGTELRFASLNRRPDGSLAPTLRTVYALRRDIPTIFAASGGTKTD